MSYESLSPRPPGTGPSAEEIAAKSFPSARRGLDPDSVHRYLMEVATTLRDARRREELLRSRVEALERQEPRQVEKQLDEDGLTEALGEETVKVLQAAREAARDLIARGERRANAMIADAESALAERSRHIEDESNALMARTRAEASEILESTREQARSMVIEAREARRRILTDLADRRRTLHVQLEQLRAGKETLSGVLDSVSESILTAVDAVRGRLDGAEEQARLAAHAASQRALQADDDLQIEEPPAIDEPSVSSDLAASLTGERSLPPTSGAGTQSAEPDLAGTGRREKTQGIDELFARIRESRQLEVAETRAQIEAVERELIAPAPAPDTPPSPSAEIPPDPSSNSSSAFHDAETNAVEEREQAATLFSSIDEPRTAKQSHDGVAEAALAPGAIAVAHEVAEPSAPLVHQGVLAQGALAEPAAVAGNGSGATNEMESVAREDSEAHQPTALELRDELLLPRSVELGRALKRTLRLEQNELLAAARHLKRPQEALVLLPAEPMASRVSASVLPSLQAAWHAGSSFVIGVLGDGPGSRAAIDPEGQTELAEISRLLAIDIVDPIRRRMEAGLTGVGDEATGISEAVTAGFRDWRASKLDELAKDYAHRVFARAVVSASREMKLKVTWLVDDGDTQCPDCDDNALSGPTIAGSLFPTGHSHPPIHPACHCVLIPVRE